MHCTMPTLESIERDAPGQWFRWECGCSYVITSPVKLTVLRLAKRHCEGEVAQVVQAYRDRLNQSAGAAIAARNASFRVV